MKKIKDFFGRVKNEKDFRFDFIIGIWSAIIIIALVVCVVLVSLMLINKDDSDADTTPIETPYATFDVEEGSDAIPTADPSIFEDEEDEGGRFEEDLDDELEFEDDGDSSMMTATTTVNVRTSPDTSATSLGKLNEGETVKKIEELSNGWTKVKFNGKEAYIKSEYLTSSASSHIGATYPPTQNNNTSTFVTNAPSITKKPVVTAKPKATKKTKVTKAPADNDDTDDTDEEPEDTEQVTQAPAANDVVITQAPEPTPPPAEPTNVPAEPTVAPADPVVTEAPVAE